MGRTADPRRAHLELHRGTWRVVVAVPSSLRAALKTSKLVHPLGTDSLRQANVLKDSHVARFKRRIAEARRALGRPGDADTRLALAFAAEAAELRRNGTPEQWREFQDAIYERHAEIRWRDARWVQVVDPELGPNEVEVPLPEQTRAAMQFSAIAKGKATPIAACHEAYLAQLTVKDRTRADDARALGLLLDWCKRAGVPPNLEAIDVKQAHLFMDDLRATGGLDPVTRIKYRGRLLQYWAYMLPRVDAVAANPWSDVTVKKTKRTREEKERPFTNAEVAALLIGPAEAHMRELIMFGALTGARLDAIVDLKVGDVVNECFVFKPQKREPGPRYVPIHADLRPIVGRRTAGKGQDADMWPEWPPVRKAGSQRERSFKASNHFTDYRRSVGVDHRLPGRRRSLVNFHSFRRWFIARLIFAGVPAHVVSALAGHANDDMTLDVYGDGPAMRAARKAIARLRLPPLDGSPIAEDEGVRPKRGAAGAPKRDD